MNVRTAEKEHALQKRHRDVTELCQMALSGTNNMRCDAYRELMTFIPKGIYGDRKGDEYLLLGVDPCTRPASTNKFYLAQLLCLTGDSSGKVITWKLIGEDDSWYKPVCVRRKLYERFTLLLPLDVADVVNKLRGRKKKQVRK